MSIPEARKQLAAAIALHRKHMDGTVKPTMESQEKMMKMMLAAWNALKE